MQFNALYFLSCTKYRSGVAKSFKINESILWFRCHSLANPTTQRPCEQNYMLSATKQLVFWYCISWLEVNDTQNDIKPSVLIHIILHRPSIGWFADETLPPRRMDPSDPSSLQALPSWARTHRKRIAPSSSKSHGQSPSAPQGPGDNEINGLPSRLAWEILS